MNVLKCYLTKIKLWLLHMFAMFFCPTWCYWTIIIFFIKTIKPKCLLFKCLQGKIESIQEFKYPFKEGPHNKQKTGNILFKILWLRLDIKYITNIPNVNRECLCFKNHCHLLHLSHYLCLIIMCYLLYGIGQCMH